MTDAVGHALDQKGALLCGGDLASMANRRSHGQNVVAVDADRRDAVGGPTRGDAVRGVLLRRGRRNGKSVVSDYEPVGKLSTFSKKGLTFECKEKKNSQYRTLERSSHVHASMCITLARSTFTEEADGNILLTTFCPLKCIARTSSLWNLSGQWARDGVKVVLGGTKVDWHLASHA